MFWPDTGYRDHGQKRKGISAIARPRPPSERYIHFVAGPGPSAARGFSPLCRRLQALLLRRYSIHRPAAEHSKAIDPDSLGRRLLALAAAGSIPPWGVALVL